MTFKINGVEPTIIDVVYEKTGEKTTLNSLGTNTTDVWGKPYSLSISAGSNTSVTVTRTSSPNQGASTGTLSSGSVIYYGDVLTISYSVSSGYKINTATVNGTTFNSGASFTVTSAISVVTIAEVSASWHTVWTGSKNISSGNNVKVVVTGLNTSAQKTRVSFVGTYWYEYEEYINYTTGSVPTPFKVEAKELACGVALKGDENPTSEHWEGQNSDYAPSNYFQYCIAKSFDANGIVFRKSSTYEDVSNYDTIYKWYTISATLTKVEQYY